MYARNLAGAKQMERVLLRDLDHLIPGRETSQQMICKGYMSGDWWVTITIPGDSYGAMIVRMTVYFFGNWNGHSFRRAMNSESLISPRIMALTLQEPSNKRKPGIQPGINTVR